MHKLEDFPGMKEMEEELVKAFNTTQMFSSPLSPSQITAGAGPGKANKDRAKKLHARLRDYWWNAIEFAANASDLPSITQRLQLDRARYAAMLVHHRLSRFFGQLIKHADLVLTRHGVTLVCGE